MLRWARFLAARTDEELENLTMEDPMLTEAKLALERLSMDPIARERAIKRDHELASFRGDLELEHEKGRAEGLRQAIERLCTACDVELSTPRREALARASVAELDGLLGEIAVHRVWPSSSA